jgi:hypothetical protein
LIGQRHCPRAASLSGRPSVVIVPAFQAPEFAAQQEALLLQLMALELGNAA